MSVLEDADAKIGHKTADSSFFGYKTHIAMTQERIITAATITTGEQNDGKELENLYSKSKETGMEIEAKNSELKHRHGYDVASSSGLIGMEMQGALALFAVNVKRILKIMNEKQEAIYSYK